jgi:opacity protein-like surface antigen
VGFFLGLLVCNTCFAAGLDELGVMASHGIENSWVKDAPNHDISNTRATLVGGKYLDENRRWKIDGELQFSYHDAENSVESVSAEEIGINLVIKREFPSTWPVTPYVGFMGGLGYLADHSNQPRWGDSGCTGKFGPLVGADLMVTPEWYLRGEYRWTHTSDPWRSDVGRNFDEFAIGIIYVF